MDGASTHTTQSQTQADPTMIIRCNQPIGPVTYRASGFLHTVHADAPPDELLLPTKPQLIRSGFDRIKDIYPRMYPLGTTLQVIVAGGPHPGKDGDWSSYETHIKNLLNRIRENQMEVQLDVWNEPDLEQFWKHGLEHFKSTYIHGYRTIKSIEPNSIVVAPSFCSHTHLIDFLDYCLEHDAIPDIISWHEFGAVFGGMEYMVNKVREWMRENNVEERPIQINEWIFGLDGHLDQYRPSVLIQFFAQAERTQLAGACHACWNETDEVNSCYQPMLNGILTPELEPRATWWVYKIYGAMKGQILWVDSQKDIDGVAAYDESTGYLSIILGYGNEGASPAGSSSDGTKDFVIQLAEISNLKAYNDSNTVSIKTHYLAYSGREASDGPLPRDEMEIPIVEGNVSLTLTDWEIDDAYWVEIFPILPEY